MTITMKRAYQIADHYLQGFHTDPADVTGAYRKIQKSTNAAAASYLARMEQKMEQDAALGVIEPLPAGRPAIGGQVKVSMTDGMVARIDQAADMLGISRSEWIRRACRAALG